MKFQTLPTLFAAITLTARALAHPGHDELASDAAPVWQLKNAPAIHGWFMKTDAANAWFYSDEGKPVAVALSNLDDSAMASIHRTTTQLQSLNAQPIAFEQHDAAPAAAAPASSIPAPESAKPFAKFKKLKLRWDTQFLYVESDGIPEHPMMKGITAWQQQVPLPQNYTGDNAWRVPLSPQVAKTPATIKGHFLRGAIAIAANGIPIFNPQNNRGEISQEIGELDQWGGHCGRGDDYHYHIVPMHLQNTVGKDLPVAYALDGYPIYGLTEPDGSAVANLDDCHGHTTSIGYHYHAANAYPYVLAAFHGQVTEREGQVDPQPRANPIRPATSPLRGAKIVDFQALDKNTRQLTYEVNGQKGTVTYSPTDQGYHFAFQDPSGQKTEEDFRARGPRPKDAGASNPPAVEVKKNETTFSLTSSVVTNGGAIPKEFTGDGDGVSPPIEWSNAPAGTKSFALVMHHIPGPGDVKWYWIVYNIPVDTKALPRASKEIGVFGNNSVNSRLEYAPPHSKGPGAKTYTLTLYALSAAPEFKVAKERVDRDALLNAIKDRTLGSTELSFTYDRTGITDNNADNRQPPGNRGQGGGGAGPAGPGGPGGPGMRLFPREVEQALNLTPDQQRQIADLEKEMREKIEKILTPEQLKTMQNTRPRRPGESGPDRGGNDAPPPPPPNDH